MRRRDVLKMVAAAFAAKLGPAPRAGIPNGFAPLAVPAAPEAVTLFTAGVRVPNELLGDQASDVFETCHQRFARAMAERIDREFMESMRWPSP